MSRRIAVVVSLIVMVALGLCALAVYVLVSASDQVVDASSLPTRLMLPTAVALPSSIRSEATSSAPADTPAVTATVSPSPAVISIASATATPSAVPSTSDEITAEEIALTTATLTVRVLNLSASMAEPDAVTPAQGVNRVPDVARPLPTPRPPLPDLQEPLADATDQAPPYHGWVSFESDHARVRYSTPWQPVQTVAASRGQYHYSDDVASRASFEFSGEALRLRYVAGPTMGVFEVVVDGVLLDTINGYATETRFPGTTVYRFEPGQHTLSLRNTGRHGLGSMGYRVALDAVQVYDAGRVVETVRSAGIEMTTVPTATLTATAAPQAAESIELVAAPPTLQATVSPMAPRQTTVSLVIAYDENGNRDVDPAEGVSDISVRVVEVSTNQVVAQTFTDRRGFARLELVSDEPLRVVVPYFGAVWDVPSNRNGGGDVNFTLLLQPSNQPGLIP